MRQSTVVALKAAVAIGLLGFLISRWYVIRFADTQSAVVLLALWYVVFFAFINLTVFWIWRVWDFRTLRASLGLLLLWFGALVAFYWPASQYTVLVTGAPPPPSVLLATEDDLVFEGWFLLLGTRSLDAVAPALALAGAFLLSFSLFFLLHPRYRRSLTTFSKALLELLALVAGALEIIGLGAFLFGTLWVEGVLTYAFTPAVLWLLAFLVLTPKAFTSAMRRILHVGVG